MLQNIMIALGCIVSVFIIWLLLAHMYLLYLYGFALVTGIMTVINGKRSQTQTLVILGH
jgi:hypothetical protein